MAPVFIILSMMQDNLTRVRIYMICGCTTFVIYGLVIDALPVVLANFMIGAVTFWYLVKGNSK